MLVFHSSYCTRMWCQCSILVIISECGVGVPFKLLYKNLVSVFHSSYCVRKWCLCSILVVPECGVDVPF